MSFTLVRDSGDEISSCFRPGPFFHIFMNIILNCTNNKILFDNPCITTLCVCVKPWQEDVPYRLYTYIFYLIVPKWEKSRTFSDQNSVHFGSASQNVLNSNLEKSPDLSNLCPNDLLLSQTDNHGRQSGHSAPRYPNYWPMSVSGA